MMPFASLPWLFPPTDYFINKMYGFFLCNIALSKHSKTWENTRVVLGNHSVATWFPNATLIFSQLPACLDEAILHGNTFYISWATWLRLTVTLVNNTLLQPRFFRKSGQPGQLVVDTPWHIWETIWWGHPQECSHCLQYSVQGRLQGS